MSHTRIEVNPQIIFGKPAIKGTRITVGHILRKLSGGQSFNEIIAAHPHLTIEDIYAAVAFAADYISQEQIRPLATS